MNPREAGFLLLTGYLGDPERKPLTIARFRDLTRRAQLMEKPEQERELNLNDLLSIGCSRKEGERILNLLSQTQQMQWYLSQGRARDCFPITRVSDDYPDRLRNTLGLDAPGVLWSKGDRSLLRCPKIALVGSRELRDDNREFAKEVGRQAALQGYVLVSGDARGADRTAQESCLEAGGRVISVVCDRLDQHPLRRNTLFLSEDGFDLSFAPQRALQRNRVIHALGEKTFVAQCSLKTGGTWDGTSKNLRFGWSPVFCYDDETPVAHQLDDLGASLIGKSELRDISALMPKTIPFL